MGMDFSEVLLSPWLWGAAGLVGLLAWAVVHFLLPRLRPGDLEKILPEHLRRNGVVLDLSPAQDEARHALTRVLVVGVRGRWLLCEVLEDAGSHSLVLGDPLRAEFRPLRLAGVKLNSFTTAFAGEELATDRIPRVLLEPPGDPGFHPRRVQSRKKVVDPQFIRAKLWFVSPDSPEGVRPADTAPHLAVNDFDVRSGQASGGSILNISKGGVGLELKKSLVGEHCAAGASMVLNLSMFSFKGKHFKSYWYAAVVRSVEEAPKDTLRVGLEFLRAGVENPADGSLRWTPLA